MTPSAPSRRDSGYAVGDRFRIVVDRQTYKNLLYLLLAFPLGFAYAMMLGFGLAFGAILSLVVIGFAILIGTVVGSRLLARLERWLANALLGLELRAADDIRSPTSAGPWATIGRYLEAPSTWQGLGFLLLKFWVGFAALMVLLLLGTSLSLLTAPFRYPHEVEFVTVNDEPIVWTIETLPEALLAAPIGALLGLAFLHVSNAFASVAGWMAVAMLGEPEALEDGPADPSN
ncbi:sensor domain-containing protein [Natronobeatus ordinarius]|uniref:sensor domain-containing protein n=1 Tax=Natronobeatus ordinarius TaxID=2963433 RepID=UPI0020CFD0B2|nr:sensor domain-containing protein [Natronobeatus ordinarius]